MIKNGIETFNRRKGGNMLEIGMYRYIIIVKNNIFMMNKVLVDINQKGRGSEKITYFVALRVALVTERRSRVCSVCNGCSRAGDNSARSCSDDFRKERSTCAERSRAEDK